MSMVDVESCLGWKVQVDDRLRGDERAALVRIVDPSGHEVQAWRVVISTTELGYPVRMLAPDGRLRGFGGPSHPTVDMALVRGDQALDLARAAAVNALPALVEEGVHADNED
jgi:hypothetical protein